MTPFNLFKIEDIKELRESILVFSKKLQFRKSVIKQIEKLPDEELLKLLNEATWIKNPQNQTRILAKKCHNLSKKGTNSSGHKTNP